MADIFTREKRSQVMARIRNKNTGPEKMVRSLLHRLGYRFRLQRQGLPGRPDIVLPKYKTVVFVHGCFWHQHEGCSDARPPLTNRNFWIPKLESNKARDTQVTKRLNELGWNVVVVWECQLKSPHLERDLLNAIESPQ